MAIDYHGLNNQIAALSRALEEVEPRDRCARLAALAWYQRQGDPVLAIQMVHEAEIILATLPPPGRSVEVGGIVGRLHLVRADIARQSSRLDEALDLIAGAEEQFRAAGDVAGQGDCLLSRSDIYNCQGDASGTLTMLRQAAACYAHNGDPVRLALAQCWLAYHQQYQDPATTRQEWYDRLRPELLPDHPTVTSMLLAYQGSVAFQQGNFPDAIRAWTQGLDHASRIGAVLLSIQMAMQIGSAFANLFDLPAALEWKERAHLLAKDKGWPESLGVTLASLAETTISVKQFDRAENLFKKAFSYLDDLPATRRHAIACIARGNLNLATVKPEDALACFLRAREIIVRLGHSDLALSTGAGIANAHLLLNRLEDAKAEAEQAHNLAVKANIPYYQIETLRVLANVQRETDKGDPRQSIAILEQAVHLGSTMDGLTLKTEILDTLAANYEEAGDHRKALMYERRARDSWQRNFDKQNGARILAMQVRFDTARAKADAEHHRRLAEAEAARAAELDRANQTLGRLGSIGQEITARLDTQAVFDTLSRHLNELMDANTLFVGLTDEATQSIDIRFRMEDGQRLPPRRVSMSSDSLSARCVRENEEMLVTWDQTSTPPTVPGTRPMRTVLYRPLALGDRVLGVVSVQSEREKAYGPRELLIFRSICSYGAIAMANAEAYQQLDRAVADLREALHRLVQQEKMAALGQLVAGVAHEVNTPLGNALAAVSQLNDNIRGVRNVIAQGGLTRSALTEHLESAQDLSDLAQRNVIRAAEMVRSFKEVAVDRGSDEMRGFELGDYLRETVALMRAKVTGRGNQVTLDVPPIQMQSYPGALAQVMTNLLSNAADHAFPDNGTGTIRIEACVVGAEIVEIRVRDDGQGIDEENLSKIFDPFFTTRRASGHMGLGLHVAFNQVTQRLNGTIDIDSMPGRGTTAIVRIPREMSGPYSSPNNHSQAF